ncbi:hypothetical protein AX14_011125 [Amanita brunnescens Koide BX004]|nr:hypothetical protein AX14_011125 [Amanita brunnescens Koide BX004]
MDEEETSLTPSSSHKFTDAHHKKKDEEVALDASIFFAAEQQELSRLDCAILLQCINRSEGKLQATVNAFQFLCENPKLESALKKAWRTKDYKEIRESELLTVLKRKDELSIPIYWMKWRSRRKVVG